MSDDTEDLLTEDADTAVELEVEVAFDPAEINADFDDDFDDDFEMETDDGYDATGQDGNLL
jgi:hypothetical protein